VRALHLLPVTIGEANDFVRSYHRHNKPVVSARFAIGASDGAAMVGVAIVGRPVARKLQDGVTAEVVRCCTLEDAPKGTPSFLYAACWRAWRAMGGAKLLTYTLQSEGGASLRGAGWTLIAELKAGNPKAWLNRHGREFQAVVGQAKFRWERAA
jgi:hypothetical protein